MASPQEEEAVKTGVPIENSAHNKTKQDETLPDTDSGSGSETGEKPVREKLKQTDLEEAVHPSATAEVDEDGEVGVETSRDKLNKKRSFEDLEEKDEAEQPSTPSSGVHARKRSRDTRSRQTRKTASLLKHSEVVPEYEEETLEHSGEESERLLDTPQSSGDDSMGSTDNVDSHLKKKRSAEELDAGEHVSLMNKVQATDKMKERRSSPESESRPATQNPSPSNTKNDMGAREVSEPPKVARKRSRDKMEEEDTPNQEQENNQVSTTEATKADSSNSPSDVSKPVAESPITHDADKTTKPPITGGFGNTSAVSPFASTSPKKTQLQTTVNDSPQASASPFAASGFASMSGSTSPFGALGSSSKAKTASPPATELPQTSSSAFSGSGFASMTGTTSPFGSIGTKPSGSVSPLPASSFAATTSQSGFGSLGSKGFGTGLASGFGSGSKLTSFAAPVGDAKLSSGKEAKPFGAPASDSEGHSNDEEDSASDEKATDSKADEESPSETKSFGEPEVEAMKERKFKIRNAEVTGEEGEKVAYSSNAKLYQFVDRQWVERGSGILKLNYTFSDLPPNSKAPYDTDPNFRFTDIKPGEGKLEARLLMRNVATLKVLLNARIFKEMRVGDREGDEPSDRRFFLSANVDGKISTYLLKIGGNNGAQLLYTRVKQAQNML